MTQQLSGGGVPRAGMPGRGVGNVPFAPGMVSGSLGPPPPTQGAPGPPMPPGPPGPGSPPPAPGSPPGGPQPNPAMGGGLFGFDPAYWAQMVSTLMMAYTRAGQGGRLPWGYQ